MRYLAICFINVVASIFISCVDKPNCDYTEGQKLYFAHTFNFDISKLRGENYLYILPIESCEGCVYSNLNFLKDIKSEKLTIIFVGENHKLSWVEMINKIRSNLKTLDDPLKKVYNYETGLRKPLLILMYDGNCINSQTVNDTEVTKVFSSLSLGD
ncbi:hypothetical protein MASR2M41_14520 [Flammeovirgaceae bacterium]